MSTNENPPTPQPPETVERVVARLAALPDLEYEQRRKEEAKRLNVRVQQLDAEVRSAVARSRRVTSADAALTLPEHEPWPEPVNGAELLDELNRMLRIFLALPPGASEAMALWILHTHTFAAADIAPRLAFVSPEKRCGKPTALKILGHLVERPLPTANLTPAVLFRIIEATKPTLLIDEADTFLGNDKHELRGILNSGHEPENARVLRCTGDKFEPRSFSTWAPIAIAKIGGLPDTLEDRSIIIRMKRKLPRDQVQRLTRRDAPNFKRLGCKIVRWAKDNVDLLQDAEPEIPEALNDRTADNWRPLLAIADRAGGDWPRLARDAALIFSPDPVQDSSVSVMLLADIRTVFDDTRTDKLSSKDICSQLSGMEHRPWADYCAGSPISPSQLARLLDDYGIRPGTIRLGERATPKGYKLEQFNDAFSRYLPPTQPATPPHTDVENHSGIAMEGNGGATNTNRSTPDDVRGCTVATGDPDERQYRENDCGAVAVAADMDQ